MMCTLSSKRNRAIPFEKILTMMSAILLNFEETGPAFKFNVSPMGSLAPDFLSSFTPVTENKISMVIQWPNCSFHSMKLGIGQFNDMDGFFMFVGRFTREGAPTPIGGQDTSNTHISANNNQCYYEVCLLYNVMLIKVTCSVFSLNKSNRSFISIIYLNKIGLL